MQLVRKAKLSSKGQVTIPQDVRKALRLREGDVLTFAVDETGQLTLRSEQSSDPVAGWLGAWREGEGLTLTEILEREREQRGW